MHVGGDHLGHWFSLPLRGHVSHAVDRVEVEAVVLDMVSVDLVRGHPSCVGSYDIPAERFDPLSGSPGGDGSVGVTGEEHEVVFVFKDLIDPHRCLVLVVVHEFLVIGAHAPGLDSGWDVQGSSELWLVHVGGNVVSENFLFVGKVLHPWSVLSHSVSSHILLFFSVNDDSGLSLVLLKGNCVSIIDWSVQVIPVVLSCKINDGIQSIRADLRKIIICSALIIKAVVAVVSLVCFQPLLWDHVEIEDSIWECWPHIEFPISGTISYHSSVKINVSECWVVHSSQVVLVNLPSKVWSVNTSVTLSRYPQFVALKLWELRVPVLKSVKCILRLRHIIMLPGHVGLGYGISNTSWTFNVK